MESDSGLNHGSSIYWQYNFGQITQPLSTLMFPLKNRSKSPISQGCCEGSKRQAKYLLQLFSEGWHQALLKKTK